VAGRLQPSIDHYGYTTGGVFVIKPSCPFWMGSLFNSAPDGQSVHEELAGTDVTVEYKGHKNWRVRIMISVFQFLLIVVQSFLPHLSALSCPHVLAGLAVAL
jgi:hypothetical protein